MLSVIEEANQEYKDEWIDVAIDSDLVGETEPVPDPAIPNARWYNEIREDVVKVIITGEMSLRIGKFPAAGRLFILLKREGLAENKSPMGPHGTPDKRLFPLGDLAMLISAEMVQKIRETISSADQAA
jgi:hypothetical protein